MGVSVIHRRDKKNSNVSGSGGESTDHAHINKPSMEQQGASLFSRNKRLSEMGLFA